MLKQVVLVGGGYSIVEGIETGLWEKLKQSTIEIWSLNWAYKTMPYYPTRECWIDINFFTSSIQELWDLWKHNVTCYAKDHPKYKYLPDIHSLPTTRNPLEFHDKIYIAKFGLTGYFALSLACREKYERIYLLGYDFGVAKPYNEDGTKNTFTHYYQNKIAVPSRGAGHPELYKTPDAKVEDFEIYLKEPCKIYNVSLSSNIKCFEKIDYPTFYKLVKEEK